MIAKLFEVRDKGTFIPVMAISIEASDGYLARRAGFVDRLIEVVHLSSQRTTYDFTTWDDRTMQVSHFFISENWDKLVTGEVIDVEYILGETKTKKISESETCFL